MEKLPFFRSDMPQSVEYRTGRYGQIGVYRVKQRRKAMYKIHHKRTWTFSYLF